MNPLVMLKNALAVCLAVIGLSVQAAEYYLVVPVKGKHGPAVTVELNSATLPAARVGKAYLYDFSPHLVVKGDDAFKSNAVTWSALSTFPAGLALGNTGVLSGIPVSPGEATINIGATYGAQQDSQQYTLSIAPFIPFVASGGAVTEANGYRIHTFTADGTFNVSSLSSDGVINVLVIAGGGGGAGGGLNVGGGGGGAGGFVSGAYSITSPGAVTVTVGAGGAGGPANGKGASGANSVVSGATLGTITAVGGGNGGMWASTAGNGGSGGGNSGGTGTVGQGVLGQGYSGALTYGTIGQSAAPGGGGGGAGAAASSTSGGAGKASTISGGSIIYAKGGNGGAISGGSAPAQPANTGNGGAGGSGTNALGGAGGSGVVIFSYPLN